MELGIFCLPCFLVWGALISVVFTAIDKKYPDVLANASYVSSPMNEDVRNGYIHSLRCFSFVSSIGLGKERNILEKNADRRNITSLKWPHYVTTFCFAFFSIATSVVVTIYYYLGSGIGSKIRDLRC